MCIRDSYKTMPPSNTPNINFHGLALRHKLPVLSEIRNAQWFTKVDIVDAPQLVLVLPARKELAVSYTHLTLPTSDLV